MKILQLLSAILFFCTTTVLAQTRSPRVNEFLSQCKAVQDEYAIHYEKKDYSRTTQTLKKGLDLANRFVLSSEDSSHYSSIQSIKATFYYNLACSYSLQKKRKAAVQAFLQAIEHGWTDYRLTVADSDLEYVRRHKAFVAALEKIKQWDTLALLQSSGKYQKEDTDSLPRFSYQSAEHNNLRLIRNYFKLDSIAGTGDELSKIVRLMNFVHNTVRHDGSNSAICEFNAIDLFHYHKATGQGINCRHLAIMLNEMFLSMGIPSRYVTCMPQSPTDGDCHVINSVYCHDLKKWIWVDPSFNAMVKDEQGNYLGIAEVRERLVKDLPLVLSEDANWNNQIKQTVEHYLKTYMAKNLYWVVCAVDSRFNSESRYRNSNSQYVALKPLGYDAPTPQWGNTPYLTTHDVNYFWQTPSF